MDRLDALKDWEFSPTRSLYLFEDVEGRRPAIALHGAGLCFHDEILLAAARSLGPLR